MSLLPINFHAALSLFVQLYEAFTNPKVFAKLTKKDCKMEEDGSFTLLGKLVTGKTLEAVKNRKLRQVFFRLFASSLS